MIKAIYSDRRNPLRRAVLGLSLAAGILFSCGAWAASGAQACQLKEYASLPLVVGDGGPPVVTVIINDHDTGMWLDIGSGQSILDDGGLARLGLKARSVPYNAPQQAEIGGRPLTHFAVVPTFRLGTLQMRDVEILLRPTRPIPPELAIDHAIVGVLSPTSLLNLDVELDLAHHKMNLFLPSLCIGTYWSSQYAVVPMHQGAAGDWHFDMELDGKRLQSKFTTDTQSYIFTNVTTQIYGWDAGSPGVEAVQASGGGTLTRYRAMSLAMHGLSVMNAQIYLRPPTGCENKSSIAPDADGAEAFTDCFNVAPLEIGTGVLKQLRIYMAVKQQKLYFTTAGAH